MLSIVCSLSLFYIKKKTKRKKCVLCFNWLCLWLNRRPIAFAWFVYKCHHLCSAFRQLSYLVLESQHHSQHTLFMASLSSSIMLHVFALCYCCEHLCSAQVCQLLSLLSCERSLCCSSFFSVFAFVFRHQSPKEVKRQLQGDGTINWNKLFSSETLIGCKLCYLV